MLSITTLAHRTTLPIRRVQYVCDHRIVPGIEATSQGFGKARTFTPYEAVCVATAAHLLHAGCIRKVTAAAMAYLCKPGGTPKRPVRPPLEGVWQLRPVQIQIGDGAFVRVNSRPEPGPWQPLARTGHVLQAFWLPAILFTIQLDAIAAAVRADAAFLEV